MIECTRDPQVRAVAGAGLDSGEACLTSDQPRCLERRHDPGERRRLADVLQSAELIGREGLLELSVRLAADVGDVRTQRPRLEHQLTDRRGISVRLLQELLEGLLMPLQLLRQGTEGRGTGLDHRHHRSYLLVGQLQDRRDGDDRGGKVARVGGAAGERMNEHQETCDGQRFLHCVLLAQLVAPRVKGYDTSLMSYESFLRLTNVDDRAMDRAELEQQLQANHAASFAWTMACCDRDRDDAEDVLQTVYVKVLDGKARFEGRAAFRTWLFAVIRRTAAAHRRTRWLRRLRFLQDDTDHADGHESAERQLVRSERAAALLRALTRLARRQREVLELVFYHDMTIEQAGQTLGISIGSARVHYQRGKK